MAFAGGGSKLTPAAKARFAQVLDAAGDDAKVVIKDVVATKKQLREARQRAAELRRIANAKGADLVKVVIVQDPKRAKNFKFTVQVW